MQQFFLILFLFSGLSLYRSEAFTQIRKLGKDHPSYLRAEQIMQRLAFAGYAGIDLPDLEIIAMGYEKGIGAEYVRQSKPRIRVEEKLIALCDEFDASDDALALIIAHELAHHYHGHKSLHRFAAAFERAYENEEADADYYGTKYCILAGYQSHKIFPALISRIYEAYQLPDSIDGYPSKEMRIVICREQVDALLPFSYQFRAAKYLMIRKNFRAAAAIYADLADRYPGREIFHNLGISYAQEALTTVQENPSFFMYPFELAPGSRLDQLRTRLLRGENPGEGISKPLLEKASDAFDKALKRDPQYYPARISLAAIYILLDNAEMAIGQLKKLPQKSVKEHFAFQTVSGIAYHYMDKPQKAKEALEIAHDIDPQRGRFNLSLITRVQEEGFSDMLTRKLYEVLDLIWPEEVSEEKCEYEKEMQMGSMSLNKGPQRKQNFYHSVSETPIITKVYTTPEATRYALEIENEHGLRYTLLILESSDSYTAATSQGIKQGSSRQELLQAYCKPDQLIQGLDGTNYYHYERARLIFTIDKGKVKRWTSYMISI